MTTLSDLERLYLVTLWIWDLDGSRWGWQPLDEIINAVDAEAAERKAREILDDGTLDIGKIIVRELPNEQPATGTT